MPQPVMLKKLNLKSYEDRQDVLELTPQKDVLFIIGDWNAKCRQSRNTWSNRQIWPWSTEWSRAKVNRFFPWESTGHSKHPLPTTQEKTLHIPKSDLLYSLRPQMEKLYTVNRNKTESWLWLKSWTPYCKFRLKLKIVTQIISEIISLEPFEYSQLDYLCTRYNVFMTWHQDIWCWHGFYFHGTLFFHPKHLKTVCSMSK